MLTSRIGSAERFVEVRSGSNDEFHINFHTHKSLTDESRFNGLPIYGPGSVVNGASACYRSKDYMITSVRVTRESAAHLLRALGEIL